MSDEARYWDRNGRPIGLFMASYLSDFPSYRFLARTVITSTTGLHFRVLTIWRGLDILYRSPHDGGMIFETTAFRPDTWDDAGSEEAATEREAIHMHDTVVARIVARAKRSDVAALSMKARRQPVVTVTHQPIVPAAPAGGWAVAGNG